MEVWYGYFSTQQRKLSGSCFYFDLEGKEVEITEVAKTSPKEIKRSFSDFTYVGLVEKWSRVGFKKTTKWL